MAAYSLTTRSGEQLPPYESLPAQAQAQAQLLPLEDPVSPLHQQQRPPYYSVHDPLTAAFRARAIMTGASLPEENWAERIPVPSQFRVPPTSGSVGSIEGVLPYRGSGSGGASVGSAVAETLRRESAGCVRASVVEVEEGEMSGEEEEGEGARMLPRGGRNMPPVVGGTERRRKWSGGISWRRNELVRSAEKVRELEGGLEVERCGKRKRRFSRRATSTVATFGRNVKSKVAGWWKRDSVGSNPYWVLAGVEVGREAGEQGNVAESESSVPDEDGAETLAAISPSLRYVRNDGGPLVPCHANLSLMHLPEDEAHASYLQSALPVHFLPHLSDTERVTHSQMLEQMEADLSQAQANGRMDTTEIQRHYFSLVGNRTNPCDQATAAGLLRLESQQARERAEEEYERAEKERQIAEMAAKRRAWSRLFDVQWAKARRDEYVSL